MSPYETTLVIRARASRAAVEFFSGAPVDVINTGRLVSVTVDVNAMANVEDAVLFKPFDGPPVGANGPALDEIDIDGEVNMLGYELSALLDHSKDVFVDVALRKNDDGAPNNSELLLVFMESSELEVRLIEVVENWTDGSKLDEVLGAERVVVTGRDPILEALMEPDSDVYSAFEALLEIVKKVKSVRPVAVVVQGLIISKGLVIALEVLTQTLSVIAGDTLSVDTTELTVKLRAEVFGEETGELGATNGTVEKPSETGTLGYDGGSEVVVEVGENVDRV